MQEKNHFGATSPFEARSSGDKEGSVLATNIIHTPGLRHALIEEIGGRHAQVLRWLQVAKSCFVAAYIQYNLTKGGLHNQRLSQWRMLMGHSKGCGSNTL
ncbi:unnamed protein product [Effrenium voratum]|nr:unnamed protein product [Effrenium voratum]